MMHRLRWQLEQTDEFYLTEHDDGADISTDHNEYSDINRSVAGSHGPFQGSSREMGGSSGPVGMVAAYLPKGRHVLFVT